MSDKKPERLGKLDKPRKFAPKRPTKKPDKAAAAAKQADDIAGPSASTTGQPDEDDPFSKLIEQAKLAKSQDRRFHSARRTDKLTVAFGGKDPQVRPLDTGKHFIPGKPQIKQEEGATGAVRSGGGVSSSGKAVKPDEEALLAALAIKEEKRKARLTFLDASAYYPTMLPFKEVSEPHDSEALWRSALPEDLAAKAERAEGETASTLGLTATSSDSNILLLQLPLVLPSVALQEATQRRNATPGLRNPSEYNMRQVQKAPEFLSGSEVLQSLPSGKVGTVRVMRSGKVRLKMGCTEFVVTPGVHQQTRGELHVINLRTGDIVMVAENSQHAVAAVDLQGLLSTAGTGS